MTEEAQEYFAPVDMPKPCDGGGARIFCARRCAKIPRQRTLKTPKYCDEGDGGASRIFCAGRRAKVLRRRRRMNILRQYRRAKTQCWRRRKNILRRKTRQSTVTEEAQEYFAPEDAPKHCHGGGARIFCSSCGARKHCEMCFGATTGAKR